MEKSVILSEEKNAVIEYLPAAKLVKVEVNKRKKVADASRYGFSVLYHRYKQGKRVIHQSVDVAKII
jgi:hypothetical protein